jgi:hypothetical protein
LIVESLLANLHHPPEDSSRHVNPTQFSFATQPKAHVFTSTAPRLPTVESVCRRLNCPSSNSNITSTVGEVEGEVLGADVVGDVLGADDVGPAVGPTVGLPDGADVVGERLGLTDGETLGALVVGELVGSVSVGDCDGPLLGDEVEAATRSAQHRTDAP